MNRRQTVYTVSMVNQYIKNMFVRDYALNAIFVKGEVSNCKYHSSGHIYFTIKDKASQITCVMFAGQRGGLSFRMEDGQEVIVGGNISVYERDGKYQLYAAEITLAGDGALYEKYEKLKKNLEAEGLFDQGHKREIPLYAKRVGIVTARTGAAIQDVVNISTRRNPYVQLVLYPAKVQGVGAYKTIIDGILTLEEMQVDVIIIGRGGGSIEDLWNFNEEELAYAIYNCKTPIISAVGHETDTTIADYVADLRAPTPSAAAELAVYDVNSVLDRLENGRTDLNFAMRQRLTDLRKELDSRKMRLNYLSPQNQLQQKRQFLMDMEEKLQWYMSRNLKDSRQRLQLLAGKLDALSPLKKLKGGYSFIETTKGDPLSSVKQVKTGDTLNISVADGHIEARVEQIKEQ